MKIKLATRDLDGEKICSGDCALYGTPKDSSYGEAGFSFCTQKRNSCHYIKQKDKLFFCCTPGADCIMKDLPIGKNDIELGKNKTPENNA